MVCIFVFLWSLSTGAHNWHCIHIIAFYCVSQRTTCGCGRAGNAAEQDTKKSSWHRIVVLIMYVSGSSWLPFTITNGVRQSYSIHQLSQASIKCSKFSRKCLCGTQYCLYFWNWHVSGRPQVIGTNVSLLVTSKEMSENLTNSNRDHHHFIYLPPVNRQEGNRCSVWH